MGRRGVEYFGWDLERGSERGDGCRGMGRVVYLPLESREAGGRPLVGGGGVGLEGGGEDSVLENEGALDVGVKEGMLVDGTNESNGRAMGGGGWKRKVMAVAQSWV